MRVNAHPKLRQLFRLRTILLLVILSVLLLPLAGLYFFRFYENELVRNTEIELIMQSAAFSAVYRELIGQNHVEADGVYTPVFPQLDLSKQKILPRRPDARTSTAYNQTIGYPKAQMAGRSMQKILLSTQKVTLSGIRILDANGVVVAGRGDLNKSLAHVKEIKQALKGNYASVLRERISDQPPPSIASLSRGTGIRVFTAYPIIDQGKVYGVVYLSRTPKNILKHLYSIKEKVILLGLMLLFFIAVIVMFVSARLSRPIRELIEQTQKVTQGELKTVEILKNPGTYEIAELSNSFSEMSHTLHERSQYIQQFASHVSHEFKTPLTSMQGGLELLQEHADSMPEEQRQKFINNLVDDTERLKRLVNRLLEQARADALSGSPKTSSLLKTLEELRSRYQDSKLILKYDQEKADCVLKIPPSELQSVFGNLVDNSLQHNASEITIAVSKSDTQLEISVQDNGSGISEANMKRIFTPFFTTRRDTGGTGLGLGIIESILKASNGEIRTIKSNYGAHFIITLEYV